MKNDFHLSETFDFPSFEDWLAIVERDLKGAPFEKKLVKKSHEGIALQPIYTSKDFDHLQDLSGFPGQAPYLRGGTALGHVQNGWDRRQEYGDADPSECNRTILADFRYGVTSVCLRPHQAFHRGMDSDDPQAQEAIGRGGTTLACLDDVATVLDGLDPAEVAVAVKGGSQGLMASGLLFALCRNGEKGEDALKTLRGTACFDPLSALASGGGIGYSLDNVYRQMADLVAWKTEHAPQFRPIAVTASPYHDAGAHAVQELAFSLATAVTYLRELDARGIGIDEAAASMQFLFSVGRHMFLEIAKLRAARMLWARVVEASGGSENSRTMFIHARSSAFTKTVRDPWVNLLRSTAECFSSVVGGADSIATMPFDETLGTPDAFSRRIAANTQNVLQEESNLHKVVDPAGGSWYIETVTRQMAEAAWTLFQDIENRGGMAEAIGSGWVAEQVEATWSGRKKAIAKRKDAITGVSEFPNLQEKPIEKKPIDFEGLYKSASETLPEKRKEALESGTLDKLGDVLADPSPEPGSLTQAVVEAFSGGATVGQVAALLRGDDTGTQAPALGSRRAAEPFEHLRDASDIWLATHGERPKIFLANMGTIPEHKARAMFSANFFEAGGLESVSNDGFSNAEDAAAAFKESGANAAVICSTDKKYPEVVPEVAPKLAELGAKFIVLAGKPADAEKETLYRDAGVNVFIHLGCDVLGTLEKILTGLDILA